jgi:hypothetical protein
LLSAHAAHREPSELYVLAVAEVLHVCRHLGHQLLEGGHDDTSVSAWSVVWNEATVQADSHANARSGSYEIASRRSKRIYGWSFVVRAQALRQELRPDTELPSNVARVGQLAGPQ